MTLPQETVEFRIIDSHTAGEPTRTIVAGTPVFSGDSPREQIDEFQSDYDWIRTALVTEPRGYPAMVGAMLLPPIESDAVARVIFFNNIGYLGMCGHGTIGVAATLAHLGKISPGQHHLETIVGNVKFLMHEDNRVSFANVASYRHRAAVELKTKSFGNLTGDIAFGGNWFFVCADHGLQVLLENRNELTRCAEEIKAAIATNSLTGEKGGVIDHIALLGPPTREDANAKNFILCPGGEYDRSPCGTGTSAIVACLAAEEKLQPGVRWRQESITGSVFEASFEPKGDKVIPTITGEAFITLDGTAVIDPLDPLAFGVSSQPT